MWLLVFLTSCSWKALKNVICGLEKVQTICFIFKWNCFKTSPCLAKVNFYIPFWSFSDWDCHCRNTEHDIPHPSYWRNGIWTHTVWYLSLPLLSFLLWICLLWSFCFSFHFRQEKGNSMGSGEIWWKETKRNKLLNSLCGLMIEQIVINYNIKTV